MAPTLLSPRLRLRAWQTDDAERLYLLASDPDVGTRADWAPHQSVAESRSIIQTVFTNDTTWAIELDGLLVGAIGYGPSCDCGIPARENEPAIGYWIGKPYWNQGICTEALQCMLSYIRQTAADNHITSLISGHFMDNLASGRVMEKCGFRPTGDISHNGQLPCNAGRPVRVLRLEL